MKKDGFMKDALILFVITLIAGLCLGGVYEITKEPIAIAKMAAKAEAYQQVYQTAVSFKEASDLSGQVEASAQELAGKGYGNVLIEEVVLAIDASGAEVGYVVTSTSKDGYGGNITITVGISDDGTVQGIEFLTITETAGLGMNAEKPDFKNQFIDKKVESFTIVKSGASADNEINSLSGATITSDAVSNAVNAAIYFVTQIIAQ